MPVSETTLKEIESKLNNAHTIKLKPQHLRTILTHFSPKKITRA